MRKIYEILVFSNRPSPQVLISVQFFKCTSIVIILSSLKVTLIEEKSTLLLVFTSYIQIFNEMLCVNPSFIDRSFKDTQECVQCVTSKYVICVTRCFYGIGFSRKRMSVALMYKFSSKSLFSSY